MKDCTVLCVVFLACLQHCAAVIASKFRIPATTSFTLDSEDKLSVLRDHVAKALGSPGYTKIEFQSPRWRVPLEVGKEEIPYKPNFIKISDDEGQYDQGLSTIYVSSNPSGALGSLTWDSSEDEVARALGFGERANKVSPAEAEKNAQSKHAVIDVNFGECGYFAHAMDNVFPRVAAVWEGARKAGFKVSVVIPFSARGFFSHNTEVMFNELGMDVLARPPDGPHRALNVQFVSSWNHFLKRSFQLALRSTVLRGVEPARCGNDQPIHGAFLSRKEGANNGRWIPGSEMVEEELGKQGWKIYSNMGSLDLKTFASDLYRGVCTLGGFEGGGMMNLIFLPPRSTVVVLNPGFPYADTWFNAHQLNDGFVHIVPKLPSIDREEATRIASLATRAREHSNTPGTFLLGD